jgi:hypothetical protein
MPPAKAKAMGDVINEMIAQGLIEESDSDYCSPAFLKLKTDGSWRFILDYRKLNEKSRLDGYRLPRIDDYLDQIGTPKFLSSFDLKSAYWQLGLSKSSRHKAAFSTPQGHYQPTRAMYGLKNAGKCFQRMIDRLLRNSLYDTIFVTLGFGLITPILASLMASPFTSL